ncbi:MAG: dTDP-4-dehydrorhamnose 3,5-epimerase [Candidatus Cloacimonetes bacterium]|nr:dTDP-4-dehydrorhamnose 3,5-epimerase [Candidatus Cloacimonadota bacterium]
MPFKFSRFDLSGLILIEPQIFTDERGRFLELFKKSDFVAAGITEDFIQDNFSVSKKGVLRGLHYQTPPHTQGKLVHCLKGAVLDLAVDIRKDSPTFGKWISMILSEENYRIFYIPPGFAHGFYVLEDNSVILYKTTQEYSPRADKGLAWNDPDLNIDWQLEGEPILSDKDKIHPKLKEIEGIE